MHGRAERYFPLLAFFSLILGGIIGALLGITETNYPLARVVEAGSESAGAAALIGLRALAIPLVFTSLVLGGVGLEAMRAMGKLAGKMVVWMVGTTGLAVSVAYGVAWCAAPRGTADFILRSGEMPHASNPSLQPGWLLAVVFLGLGFGFYRNQLEDGHGKLFMRFCQSVDGMVLPLLHWAQWLGVAAVFFVSLNVAARATALHATSLGEWSMLSDPGYQRIFLILPTAAAVYVLALSLATWLAARVQPWRTVLALSPAMLLAAAGGSVEAALPLTMDAVRRRGGVSNRVASVALSLGAALHRDGVALLWAAAVFSLRYAGAGEHDWASLAAIGSTALLLGCGGYALAAPTAIIATLSLGLLGWQDQILLPGEQICLLLLGWMILWGGHVLSVFSHACAALVIARGEGEFWVPGPPPNPDELQGLKSELELAEG